MKKAHNVYVEDAAWTAARTESLKYKDLLTKELTKHPTGSSSAYFSLVGKALLLIDDPGLIHDSRVDWKTAIQYCKRKNLPLYKYISHIM